MTANGLTPASVATEGEGRKIDQLGGSITCEHNATTTANQELEFPPAADIFPLMEGEEFDALVADIREHGLKNPITLYHGAVIDGRNRVRACLAAGWSWRALRGMCVEISGTGAGQIDDPVAYVISVNIHRRHLTAAQKADALAKLVEAHPEKSDRAIAKMANVDHKTVAVGRKAKEARGEIPHVEKRTDTKGRKQPAKKAKQRGAKPAEPEAADAIASGIDQMAAQARATELEATHDLDLAEQLQAAKIKILGLESEVEELKAENAELRAQLEAAKAKE